MRPDDAPRPNATQELCRRYNTRLQANGSVLRWRISAAGDMRLCAVEPPHGATVANGTARTREQNR